jgi:hypothetical protein
LTGSDRKRVEGVFDALMPKPVREMKVSDIIREADGYGGSQNAAQNAIRALRPVISWAILSAVSHAYNSLTRSFKGVLRGIR